MSKKIVYILTALVICVTKVEYTSAHPLQKLLPQVSQKIREAASETTTVARLMKNTSQGKAWLASLVAYGTLVANTKPEELNLKDKHNYYYW